MDIGTISVEGKLDPTPGRGYPLKVYCEMRNNNLVNCADVRVVGYRPDTVHLKKFETDVLQLKIRKWWYPDDQGVDRVAVLPGQQFRAWVGVDENKFTKDQLDGLRKKLAP